MFTALDKILNKITMYRLVLYVLIFFLSTATVFGFFSALAFTGWQIISSTAFIVALCWLVNRIFAWVFNIQPHDDSAYITAFILALIISPYRRLSDLPLLIWAPLLAISAKYIIAWRRQHLFNPAALGVVITALAFQQAASWWIGTAVMFWPVIIGGFLIVRKIRRFEVVVSYIVVAVLAALIYGLIRGNTAMVIFRQLFIASPLLFFSTIMLTEPATMPSRRRKRIVFAGIVGLLSAPFIHFGTFYFTPELALVVGNLLGWTFERRERYNLTLRQQIPIAPSMSDLVFDSPHLPKYQPGQYLEWTLAHQHPDARGIRRYFTIASSPTEPDLRLGVKFYQPSSTYKQALRGLQPGQKIVAQQLGGDFTLPKNQKQPLVFIAGGIGITPFRSMLKYVLDRHEVRPMTLLYANQVASDIVYTDIITQAQKELGLHAVYTLTDLKNIPPDWTGQRGYLTAEMIQQNVPEYTTARFYLSGPQGMVIAYEKLLKSLKIKRSNIVTDYFPGFA